MAESESVNRSEFGTSAQSNPFQVEVEKVVMEVAGRGAEGRLAAW